MNITYEIRIKTVELYLKNGSLRKTSEQTGIPYQTIHRWVKWFKEGGKENLKRKKKNKNPWNKTPKYIEKIVISLKENEPIITLKEAKKKLENKGIKISIKGIWNIWKRYGYCGLKKLEFENTMGIFGKPNKEKSNQAKILFKNGKLKEAAKVLNSMIIPTDEEFLTKIPDKFLNLKNRVQKNILLFGNYEINEYIRNTEKLLKECLRNNLKFTALKVLSQEIIALSWIGDSYRIKEKTALMNTIIKNKKKRLNPNIVPFYLILLLSKSFLKTSNAEIKLINQCEKIIKRRKLSSPHFMRMLGTAYANIFEYKKAEYWYLKALSLFKISEDKKPTLTYLAYHIYGPWGKYSKANKLIKRGLSSEWIKSFLHYSYLSEYYFNKKRFKEALYYIEKSLENCQKNEIITGIIRSSLMMAKYYITMGKFIKAKQILLNIYKSPISKVNKRHYIILKLILGKYREKEIKNFKKLSDIKICFLLNKGKIIEAYKYAVKKDITSIFFKFLPFFYKIVSKNSKTNLPKAILKLPVFNKEKFIFEIKFLGNLKAYKLEEKRKLINFRLNPKEKAFLIHIALNIPEPGSYIPVEKIYKNFWFNSKNPQQNLSRTFSKLRKELKIPKHLLEISNKGGIKILKNNGIYFITDYTEFKEKTTRAKALINIHEYKLAKREFKSALKLIRGKPFEKMYDRWSENFRTKIIFEIEELKEHLQNLSNL